jgi:hypothetical protein
MPFLSLALWQREYLGSDPKLDPELFTSHRGSKSGSGSKTRKKMGSKFGSGSKTRMKMGPESGAEKNSFGSTTWQQY